MKCFRLLNSSHWLAIVITLCFYGESTSFKRKCAVEDSEQDRPQKPQSAPAPFVSEIESSLIKNAQQKNDSNAYKALIDSKLACKEQYVVPIAWHMIYNSQGRGNVSEVMLEDQIQVLNEAFSDTPFRFKMHSVDRTRNDDWFNNCRNRRFQIRPVLAISPATTLNIYTCQFSDPTVLGSATQPWRYHESNTQHAVVIHFGTLPGGQMTSYNRGRNAVHEVGHYFGLYHVCLGGCYDAYGDEVADTPRCSDYTYLCTNQSVDTCKSHSGLDPIYNYMGFIEDDCMREFTPGQIEKMEGDVQNYKPSLLKNIYRPCKIDAAFRWSNEYSYLFRGSNYYRYNETSHEIDPGYPRPISDHWKGVPASIDAVFQYANGLTYFFKGNQYYRFNDSSRSVDSGYPRLISDFWVGVPDNIDDVISYSNGYAYFFKGTQYYRFNPSKQSVDSGYPRPISSYWKGISDDIEAALPWHSAGVYFFKDTQIWFFLRTSDSAGVLSSYPRSVTKWWRDAAMISGYTVFRHLNGFTFFFKGDSYWSFNEQLSQVDVGYPRPLSLWEGVPVNVDAAFVWSDGYTYFFKANLYFRYDGSQGKVQDGYPRNISSFWKGVPDNVNAVFRYTNGVTYFFKDSLYYRFNDTSQTVDPGYPQPIASFWKGIPDNLDTVFTSGSDEVFFFKESLFYRFNRTIEQVDTGYPKSITLWRGILYQP